jgi:nucleotide-binding universal stress UspA family protein
MSIVVGYAATGEGRAALERAVEEVRLRGDALHVVDTSRPGRGELTEEDGLAQVGEQLSAAGIEHQLHPRSPHGDPAEDIISLADSTAAGLIVIGLRRRSPVGKLILGSNAQRILLEASCPVLAVKART